MPAWSGRLPWLRVAMVSILIEQKCVPIMLAAHKPMPDGLYCRVYYAPKTTIMLSIERPEQAMLTPLSLTERGAAQHLKAQC
jgi:hypothetical protein